MLRKSRQLNLLVWASTFIGVIILLIIIITLTNIDDQKAEKVAQRFYSFEQAGDLRLHGPFSTPA